jgi:phage tail sheath protein FI
MSPPTSCPGVYVEETPPGGRTIVGVPTSVTAFIGRAPRGPTDGDGPVSDHTFTEFSRSFGGLWAESLLGFAVRDFFANGGGTALIVRIYHPAPGARARARLVVGGLALEAASPGAWGSALRARVDHDVDPAGAGGEGGFFNLHVRDGITGDVEEFRSVSALPDHPKFVARVLERESRLVRVSGDASATRPDAFPDVGSPGDVWADNAPRTCAAVAPDARASDGLPIDVSDFIGPGLEEEKRGLFALERTDIFNVLCIPPYRADGNVDAELVSAAATYCEKKRAILLVDPRAEWATAEDAATGVAQVGTSSKNAALYFPRLRQPDPFRGGEMATFVPCGAVAGVMARTDGRRGVWKAPAGFDAGLVGVPELAAPLTDADSGDLNPLSVNCLRVMPDVGPVIWGARTLAGSADASPEWKYIPVRRLALFVEESIERGTRWVVFEPNDERLWAQIRLSVGAFMRNLFRQGALRGTTERDAYFVKCDAETTTRDDIQRGIVNILVGFAPLRPGEFIVIRIQQRAGESQA